MMETQFSWTKQWYPISPLSYLDPSNPTPVTLLNKKLVIWRDKNQNWVVMDDVCPHKLAQLSLGSITEDGNLMCRHHGWCFNSEGKCSKIPMLTGSAEETACDSSKSHVTTYPTQVIQELLWIWPDDSSTALVDCTLKHPATIPECNDVSSSWHMAEVPVGYTVSVESSFDPSHAQFLHEGIGYFSPQTAVPIQHFEAVGEMSAEDGFTIKHSGYNLLNKDMEATRKFTPPCSNTTIYHYPNGKSNIFQLYFVPTRPGYCRQIVKFIADGNSVPRNFRNLLFEILPKNLRTGLQHLSAYKLGDQDLTVMHSQEVIQSSLDKKWQKAYFMPSPADVGIVTFRKWLDVFAEGGPSWAECVEESVKDLHDELYNRWHRHTKLCPSCRESVIFIEKVRNFCQICTGLSTLLTLVFLLIGIPLKLVVLTTILAVMSLLLSYILSDFKQLFFSSIPTRGLPWVSVYHSNAKK